MTARWETQVPSEGIICSVCHEIGGKHKSKCPRSSGAFERVSTTIDQNEKQKTNPDIGSAKKMLEEAIRDRDTLLAEESVIHEQLGRESVDRITRWNNTLAAITESIEEAQTRLKEMRPNSERFTDLSNQIEELLRLQFRIREVISATEVNAKDEFDLELKIMAIEERAGKILPDEFRLTVLMLKRAKAEKIITDLSPLVAEHDRLEAEIAAAKDPEDQIVIMNRDRELEKKLERAGDFFARVKEIQEGRRERREEFKKLEITAMALSQLYREIIENEAVEAVLPEEKATQEVRRRGLRIKRDELINELQSFLDKKNKTSKTSLRDDAGELILEDLAMFSPEELREFCYLDWQTAWLNGDLDTKAPREMYAVNRKKEEKITMTVNEAEDMVYALFFASLGNFSAWRKTSRNFIEETIKISSEFFLRLDRIIRVLDALHAIDGSATEQSREMTIPITLKNLGSHQFDKHIGIAGLDHAGIKFNGVSFDHLIPEPQRAAAEVFFMSEYLQDKFLTADGLERRWEMINWNKGRHTSEQKKAHETVKEMTQIIFEDALRSRQYTVAAELFGQKAIALVIPAWFRQSAENMKVFEAAQTFQKELYEREKHDFDFNDALAMAKKMKEAAIDPRFLLQKQLEQQWLDKKIKMLWTATQDGFVLDFVEPKTLKRIMDPANYRDHNTLGLLHLLTEFLKQDQAPVVRRMAEIMNERRPSETFAVNIQVFKEWLERYHLDSARLLRKLESIADTRSQKDYTEQQWLALLQIAEGKDPREAIEASNAAIQQLSDEKYNTITNLCLNGLIMITAGLDLEAHFKMIEKKIKAVIDKTERTGKPDYYLENKINEDFKNLKNYWRKAQERRGQAA